MATFMYDIHFWSMKCDQIKDDKRISRCIYHDKRKSDDEFPYEKEKRQYFIGRNQTWVPSNKRPRKIYENLRALEDFLCNFKVIGNVWIGPSKILMLLSSGVLVVVKVDLASGDVECINIDRSLVGRLFSDNVTDVLLCDKFVAATYTEPKLTMILFNKPLPTSYGESNEQKLLSIFSNVLHLDLPGPSVKRTERRLSVNVHQNTLLVWWQSTSNEMWPWTPASTDRDRANIFVYTLVGSRIDLLCCLRQEADPLIVTFSKQHPDVILTVEESLNLAGDNSKETNVRAYEISHSKLNRIESSAAPIPGHMLKAVWNKAEDKVAIICKNGFLTVFDRYLKSSKTIKTHSCPTFVSWHKDGTIVSVCDPNGHQQVFDFALNDVRLQMISEECQTQKNIDLSLFVKLEFPVCSYMWNISNSKCIQNGDGLFILYEGGPMIFLKFLNGVFGRNITDEPKLVSQYIRTKLLSNAVSLLTCMNWNFSSEKCYSCMSRIVNYLLRCPFTDENEALIEASLGTFYNLNHDIEEDVIFQFRDKMVAFARRFFHHLLRNEKVEKAFLLAVDINSADLFMDIFHFAADCGENTLAETARAKAIEIQESFSNDSASDSTPTQCSDSSSSSSESETDLNMSPLRVSSQPSHSQHGVAASATIHHHLQYGIERNGVHQGAVKQSSGVLPNSVQPSGSHPQPKMAIRGLGGSYPWQNDPTSHYQVPHDVQITIDTSSQSETEDYHPLSSSEAHDVATINNELRELGNENDDNEGPGSVRVIHFGVI